MNGAGENHVTFLKSHFEHLEGEKRFWGSSIPGKSVSPPILSVYAFR